MGDDILKKIILIMLVALACASLAAAEGRLKITKIDGYIDGKRISSVSTGHSVMDDVKPLSLLEFSIEVQNLFTSAEKVDIDDVEIESTIFGIDDGDDMDYISSSFDLDPGEKRQVTVKYTVPLEVDDDDFLMEIYASGTERKNNTLQEDNTSIEIKVVKDERRLIISRLSLEPKSVECGESSRLSVEVANIGSSWEEVTVSAVNTDLGISDSRAFRLDHGSDSSMRNTVTVPLNTDAETKPGSYPIMIKAAYEKETLERTEILAVTCGDNLQGNITSGTADGTAQSPPQSSQPTAQPAQQLPYSQQQESQQGIASLPVAVRAQQRDSAYSMVLVVLLYVLVLGGFVILGYALLGRKKSG